MKITDILLIIVSFSLKWVVWIGNNVNNEIDNEQSKPIVDQSTMMDPFCKQAWLEYGRRFCIYSVSGLAIGAACAFVLLGLFFSILFTTR